MAFGKLWCGQGEKRAPASEAHKGCPSSLPEPRATYPQLSHMPYAGQHTASRTRTGRKFMAASGTWQLQEARAGGQQCSSRRSACSSPAAQGTLGPVADVTEWLVPGAGHGGF